MTARKPRFANSIGMALATLLLILASVSAITPSHAQSDPNGSASNAETHLLPGYVDRAALDELFMMLANAPDQSKATEISNAIWRVWFTPDEEDLANRMQAASLARANGDVRASLAMLNAVIRMFPEYAEGWNQRATLYFMAGNLEASLSDVEKVLELEPRHFGALSGQAMIYRQLGRDDLALQSIIRALSVHPFLAERALFEELLAPPTNT